MKKNALFLALAVFSATAFAYNPPAGGEQLTSIAAPELLSGSASASGGALYDIVPASMAYNPAVTVFEQRTMIHLSYTGLFNTLKSSSSDSFYGQAFQIGTIVPTKWTVISSYVQGTFSNIEQMDLGNSIMMRAGLAKDITDNFYVGLNIYGGAFFGNGTDWTLGADLGAMYHMDYLGFLQDVRIGASFTNLGKPVFHYKVTGIHGKSSQKFSDYPSVATPRLSFAATLFETRNFKGGFSLDAYSPAFQNICANASLGFSYKDMISLSTSYDVNLREIINGKPLSWPSVRLGVKFAVNTSSINKENDDWASSELSPSFAWQNLYGGVHAFSAGTKFSIGQRDEEPPVIILWNGEE